MEKERRNTINSVLVGILLVTLFFPLSQIVTTTVDASTQKIGVSPRYSLGNRVINPTSASSLNAPNGTRHALICIETNPVHWRDTGTDATTSDAQLSAGKCIQIDNDPAWISRISILDTSAGAADVNAWFYKDGTN